MNWPTIEQLHYINQWTMMVYRIIAGLAMIPVAYAAYLFVLCARKYLE